jgi:Flp pilus assembly protein TadG
MHGARARPGADSRMSSVASGVRGGRRGSELVEGMLMMLPFFALIFLIIDTSYGLFLKASLQYAVQQGASLAAADTNSSIQGLINTTVQAQLPNSTVNPVVYYAPDGSVTGSNASGNLVQVSAYYQFSPLAPLFRSAATITLTASATSVLTANPPAPL